MWRLPTSPTRKTLKHRNLWKLNLIETTVIIYDTIKRESSHEQKLLLRLR